jgi:CheY-like chemotaxis protein
MAKVLVIDDDQDIASTTAAMLKAGGHTVEIELHEKNAVSRIESVKPQLVVLDVMFPGNPNAGFEIARAIRAKHQMLPIVMVTSVNETASIKFNSKDIDEAWLPVSEFIEKPIKQDRLLELVKKLTHGSKG